MVVVSDDYADEDGIGYREHGEGLIEMIRCVESSGSFTIGVHGQWGQGKTSLLRQIKKALDKEPENGKSPIFTVWFNPWQFTGEEHLIIPFFHTLIASLEKYEKKIKRKSALSTFVQGVSTFLEKLSRVPVALAYGMEGEIKVPLLLKAKFSFDRMIKESRNQEEKIAQEERANYSEAVKQYESCTIQPDPRAPGGGHDAQYKGCRLHRRPGPVPAGKSDRAAGGFESLARHAWLCVCYRCGPRGH
jgi:predicted KAP-like P-loop ATPase